MQHNISIVIEHDHCKNNINLRNNLITSIANFKSLKIKNIQLNLTHSTLALNWPQICQIYRKPKFFTNNDEFFERKKTFNAPPVNVLQLLVLLPELVNHCFEIFLMELSLNDAKVFCCLFRNIIYLNSTSAFPKGNGNNFLKISFR